MLTDEVHCKILKLIEQNPEINQRAMARELGISLGKVNYSLRSLVEKGLIKANNFKNSQNKKAYLYLLTPRGIVEKTRVTSSFLQRKMAEYEALAREIEALKREAGR
jgi:EPS-associated MarR family transcriptional regulator